MASSLPHGAASGVVSGHDFSVHVRSCVVIFAERVPVVITSLQSVGYVWMTCR